MRYPALAFLSVAAVLVLLVPGVTGTDEFPLSSHPMYASARAEEATFFSARGVGPLGEAVELSMREIARTDDPLVAEVRMRRSVQRDGGLARCASIADWLAETAMTDGVSAVEIIEVRADVAAFAAGDRNSVQTEVLIQCPLP